MIAGPLEAYFNTLDSGDFDSCAACFAEDAVYLHPPGDRRQEDRLFALRGRREIRAWLEKRGKRDSYHHIVFAAQTASSFFAEGRAGGAGLEPATFACHAIVDKQGKIERYIAFVEYPDRQGAVDAELPEEYRAFARKTAAD